MHFQNSNFVAIHINPSWRKKANYIFRCILESNSDSLEYEQMWGQKIENGNIILCCIPFFVEGLALGDIVKVDENGIFVELLQESGNITIRAWTRRMEESAKRPFVEKMLSLVDDAEMYSDDLTAFSVLGEFSRPALDHLIDSEKALGLVYEIANR